VQERLGGAPDQEGGDVPGVQVGLGAAAEAGVVIIHPGQEGSGLAEDAAGVLVAFRAEGLPVGDRAELAQQVPGGEAFEQAPVLDVVDAGEPFGQPSLKQQQVPVDGGQHAVVHEQVPQVGGRSPGRHGVGGLVGDRRVRAGQGA
jgi:hypothetical protein